MQPGQALKRLRSDRKITIRGVERASQRIAAAKQDKGFQISNGWLAQLENGTSQPSLRKLFSLSVIYNFQFLKLLRLYDIDLSEVETFRVVAEPTQNKLLYQSECNLTNCESLASFNFSSASGAGSAALTSLVPGPSESNKSFLRGYIGLNDLTMYPLIRPGSFVLIDTRQNRLKTKTWHNEYEKPIYFVELRNGYACGWCELNHRRLLIIPHHLSPVSVRQFAHPEEAEVIGRVTRFVTDCVQTTSFVAEDLKPS
jgi:transcriptional regulator with XRE-family HTH domain